MSLAKDLMQMGIADIPAQRLGWTIGTITGAGTTNADAAVCSATATLVQVSGAGASGIKLSANAELGVEYIYANITANTINVYPPTGGNLNGDVTTTGLVPMIARATVMCIRVNTTDWAVVIGATNAP